MFGLRVTEPHDAWLGWRAIFIGGHVDIIPGRGGSRGSEEDKKLLLAWVNKEILLDPPKGRKRKIKTSRFKQMCEQAPLELRQADDKVIEWVGAGGNYVLRCNPQASHGYLYIALFKRHNFQEDIDFLNRYGKLSEVQTKLIPEELSECPQVKPYHSGGGFRHMLGLRYDGKVIAIHFDADDAEHALVETSYDTWKSLDEYLEPVDEKGFGYEYDRPDYDSRCKIIGKGTL